MYVSDGKISGLYAYGDEDKISKVITNDVYYSYVGQTASVSAIDGVDAVSSASVVDSSSSAVGDQDATSSATGSSSSGSSSKKYYVANIKEAIISALESAPAGTSGGTSGTETATEIKQGTSDTIDDSHSSKLVLNVGIKDGKIVSLEADDSSVGDWSSILSKLSENYIGKSSDASDIDAVSGATPYTTAVNVAVLNALSNSGSSGSGSGNTGSGTTDSGQTATNGGTVTIEVGETATLLGTYNNMASSDDVVWTSDDTSVATVAKQAYDYSGNEKAVVTGVKAGTTTVTLTITSLFGSSTETFTVIVTDTEKELEAPTGAKTITHNDDGTHTLSLTAVMPSATGDTTSTTTTVNNDGSLVNQDAKTENGLTVSKQVTDTDQGADKTYGLTMEAYDAGKAESTTTTTEGNVDVVIVLDYSYSMYNERMGFEDSYGNGRSDWEGCAYDIIRTKLVPAIFNSNSNARVSYAQFSNSADYSSWYTSASDAQSGVYSFFTNAMYGSETNIEAGLAAADTLLDSARTDAKKVVIFMTDGEPNLYNGGGDTSVRYDEASANAALAQAGSMTGNVDEFYGYGLAGSYDTTGSGFLVNLVNVFGGTFFNASASGAMTNQITQTVSSLSTFTTTTYTAATALDASAVLKDTVASDFSLANATVTATVYSTTNRKTWTETSDSVSVTGSGTNTASGLTLTVSGNDITVTGFDYSGNYVSSNSGKKIVVTVSGMTYTGELSATSSTVETNASGAGVYASASASSATASFPMPAINTPTTSESPTTVSGSGTTYDSVVIEDTLTEYFAFADTAASAFTVTASDNSTVTKTVTVDGQKVTATVTSPNPGVTYTLSFDIVPTQAALDAVAAGTLTKTQDTNTEATLTGKVGTKEASVTYEVPTADIPVSAITITKTWDDDDDAAEKRPTSLEITLTPDGNTKGGTAAARTVTLTSGENWTKTVTVPSGYTWTASEAAITDYTQESVTQPTGLTADSIVAQTGNAGFTNKVRAVFYVYHTGVKGGNIETIYMDSLTGTTYDITQNLTKGTLYGGYYLQTGITTIPADQAKYDGVNWIFANGETTAGTKMVPQANKTYYVKEVPTTYLKPATYIIYNTTDTKTDATAGTGYKVQRLFAMTAVDDNTYQSVGFKVVGKNGIDSTTYTNSTLYTEFNIKKLGQTYASLTAKSMFGVDSADFLAFTETTTGLLKDNGSYTLTPYWKTPDGMEVTAAQIYIQKIGDGYYYSWKTPGITKMLLSIASKITAPATVSQTSKMSVSKYNYNMGSGPITETVEEDETEEPTVTPKPSSSRKTTGMTKGKSSNSGVLSVLRNLLNMQAIQ